MCVCNNTTSEYWKHKYNNQMDFRNESHRTTPGTHPDTYFIGPKLSPAPSNQSFDNFGQLLQQTDKLRSGPDYKCTRVWGPEKGYKILQYELGIRYLQN